MSFRDTVELINAYLPDKHALYKFLLREQYFLPAENSPIMSVKFMHAVWRKEIYLPLMTEVRPIRVSDMPPKAEIKQELLQAMEEMSTAEPSDKLIDQLRLKDADVPWMLSMLHMLRPEHPFFKRDYVRAPRQVNRHDPLAREDNKHDMYKQALQGLPLPNVKRRKKTGGVANCLAKSVRA